VLFLLTFLLNGLARLLIVITSQRRRRGGPRMSPRLRWRKFVSGFMLTMTGVCALVAVSVLFFILGYLVYHGGTSINWSFFHEIAEASGRTRRRNGQCDSWKLKIVTACLP